MSALPLVVVPAPVALALNIGLWAGAQVSAGYVAHRRPVERLQADTWLLRPRRFEAGGRWYERRLRINRWKDRLPEAGAFFAGGVSKRAIPGRAEGGIERFAAETRRAELAHWWSFAAVPLCLIWNAPLGVALMVAYGLVVNLPLIAIQRYNRSRIERIMARRRTARRRGDRDPA